MRILAIFLACLMVLVDLPVRAATTTPEEDKIEQLYQRGQAKYDNQEWEAAAVLWGESLELIDEGELTSSTRSMILLNALSAFMEAFRDSRQLRFLKSAISLIDQYVESLEGREPSQAVRDAENRIRETFAQVVEKSEDEPASNASEGSSSTGESSSNGDFGGNSRSSRVEDNEVLRSDRSRKLAVGLIISGAMLGVLGLGASSLIAIGALNSKQATTDSMDASKAQDQDGLDDAKAMGDQANRLLAAGLIIAPVLVIAGSTMLGIGLAERRRSIAFAPLWNRQMVGLSVSGRF